MPEVIKCTLSYSFSQEAIEFRPLVRKHTGTYTCEAKNFLGVSQSANVEVDVKCKN